jgi:phosphoserine phosphatase RsbU/P
LDGREIELPAALPLGVLSTASYETEQFHLAHGSRLTFYSDGVVEAQNEKGELFGFDRAKSISTKSAAAIVEAAKQFGQSDDITVVAIRRTDAIASAA